MAKPKSVTIKLTPQQRNKIAKGIGAAPAEVMFESTGAPARAAGKAATKTAPLSIGMRRRIVEIAAPRTLTKISPRTLTKVSPRTLTKVSPRTLTKVSPRTLTKVSPRTLTKVSPRTLTKVR